MKFKSDTFKARIKEADDFASQNGIDKHGTRILWVALVFGVNTARLYASKRAKKNPPWDRYTNLIQAGIFVEGSDGGIVYDSMPQWEGDPGCLNWFREVVNVAAGGDPHPELPRRSR